MAALHKYAYTYWQELAKDAKPHNHYGEGNPVFCGKMTDCWVRVGASQAFYQGVRKYLIENRYIEIVEQGARNRDSVVVLWLEPPPDVEPPPPDVEIASQALTLPARFAKLESRVEALQGWREAQGGINIVTALRDFERRILLLEAQLLKNPTASTSATEALDNGKTT